MNTVDWDSFESEKEALEYLKGLQRYENTTLKSAWRRAKFFLTIVYCRIFKISKPIFMVLVTNNSCNLKCTYCYGGYGDKGDYKDYTTRELLKIIDELKGLGTLLLTVHGGESMLRKDIGEIINYCKLLGFYVSFNTNGFLIPKRVDELKIVDALCISLDGRRENNDKNRGDGCFDTVMEAIEAVQANSIPLSLHATLTRDTMYDMVYLAELAKEKGCWLQYSILYNADDLSDKDLVMSSVEMKGVVAKILELKKVGYPIYYSENVLETALQWPEERYGRQFITKKDPRPPRGTKLISCFHGSLKYQIDADGRVVTCWAHNPKNAPNIKDLGVVAALKECHDNNWCEHCSFLANNEHNALMALGLQNILGIMYIQVKDVLKISHGKPKTVSEDITTAGKDGRAA